MTKEDFLKRTQEAENGCLEWQQALRGKSGYGCLRFNGKLVDAHRVSYMLFKGEIPKGLLVMHSCDNRKCVNPEHLSLGTHKDNHTDAVQKGRVDNDILAKLPRSRAEHPSSTSYDDGCRCDGCKEVQRNRMRIWREKRKNKLCAMVEVVIS